MVIALDDFFGKFDDIIYKPVETVCNYLNEPLETIHAVRERKNMEQVSKLRQRERRMEMEFKQAEKDRDIERQKELEQDKLKLEHEKAMLALEIKKAEEIHQQEKARAEAELSANIRKMNMEIDKLYNDAELERGERIINAMTNYQLTLANAWKEMTADLSKMSIELQKDIQNFLSEKVKEYMVIQEETKRKSAAEIQEMKKMFFEDDPETYRMMVKQILDEREEVINRTSELMKDIQERVKKIAANMDDSEVEGREYIKTILMPYASRLQVGCTDNYGVIEAKL
jgi:serine phosphatase RsbU (regulator of sigma subunit)